MPAQGAAPGRGHPSALPLPRSWLRCRPAAPRGLARSATARSVAAPPLRHGTAAQPPHRESGHGWRRVPYRGHCRQ
eukprot:10801741-Lingulodinium_polyedra.AAC.1